MYLLKVLMGHLAQLPKACSMRKVNEMVSIHCIHVNVYNPFMYFQVKRIRLAVVHVCVMGIVQY